MTARLPQPLCFLLAGAACVVAATSAPAQTEAPPPGPELIEQRLQTLFPEEPVATSPPTDPALPAVPATPPEFTPRGEARPLPSPLASGLTNRLVDSETSNPVAPASTPLPGDDPSGGGWVMNTLAALGVIVGLVLLLRWAYTRVTGRSVSVGGSRAVEALSRTSIAPRNHVLLLRVGRRILVVNDSPHGMRTLAEVDDPDEVAELLGSVGASRPDSLSGSFNGLLSRFSAMTAGGREGDDAYDGAAGRSPGEGRDDAERNVDRARDQLSHLLSRVRHVAAGGGPAAGGER